MANLHLDAQAANLDRCITVLDAKLAELDAKIREANGTLKDIRAERRATEKLIQDFRDNTDARLNAVMEAVVKVGLEDLGVSIDTAIEKSTQSVYDRFDLIAGICLGEDAISKAEGKQPLEELIRAYVRKNGPVA